jgi:hypothetical protein
LPRAAQGSEPPFLATSAVTSAIPVSATVTSSARRSDAIVGTERIADALSRSYCSNSEPRSGA